MALLVRGHSYVFRSQKASVEALNFLSYTTGYYLITTKKWIATGDTIIFQNILCVCMKMLPRAYIITIIIIMLQLSICLSVTGGQQDASSNIYSKAAPVHTLKFNVLATHQQAIATPLSTRVPHHFQDRQPTGTTCSTHNSISCYRLGFSMLEYVTFNWLVSKVMYTSYNNLASRKQGQAYPTSGRRKLCLSMGVGPSKTARHRFGPKIVQLPQSKIGGTPVAVHQNATCTCKCREKGTEATIVPDEDFKCFLYQTVL